MLKTNLNNFPPSSLQPCRFTISRRKRPAEPLQHGAHGTGWGAAATAAHVPQLRWQFRGRVLNNAECPKSSCHTRNYCLTRERRIEREREKGVKGNFNDKNMKMKMRKVRKKKKKYRHSSYPSLTHTSHSSTHTHTHTFIHSNSTWTQKSQSQPFYSWFSCSTWEVAIFEYFFIIFIRIFLLL